MLLRPFRFGLSSAPSCYAERDTANVGQRRLSVLEASAHLEHEPRFRVVDIIDPDALYSEVWL